MSGVLMLYHVWGIRGYQVVGSEKVEGTSILVSMRPTPKTMRYSRCGSKDVIRKGGKSRLIRGVPVGSREMWFDVAVPRVRCDRCGVTRPMRIPFAEKKKPYTRQFDRYTLEPAQITTTQHSADYLKRERATHKTA